MYLSVCCLTSLPQKETDGGAFSHCSMSYAYPTELLARFREIELDPTLGQAGPGFEPPHKNSKSLLAGSNPSARCPIIHGTFR